MKFSSLLWEYFYCIMEQKQKRSVCLKDYVIGLKSFIDNVFETVGPVLERHLERVVEGLVERGFIVGVIDAEFVERGFVRGGGDVPIVELGVGVHPVYLVPFIPGSSLKGLVRSMFEEYLFEVSSVEESAKQSVEHCVDVVFGYASSHEGYSAQRGMVGFLDAYPVRSGLEGLLSGEVITPHYGSKGRLRSEIDVVPKPIVGVAVGRGTVFRTVFFVDRDMRSEVKRRCIDINCSGDCPGRVAQVVAGLLVRGFEVAGCCGKSGRGFGRLRVRRFSLVR